MRNKIGFSLVLSIIGLIGTFFFISAAYAQGTPQQTCAQYGLIASRNGAVAGPPAIGAAPLPEGAVITVNTTLGTATSGTFSIVGSVSGLPVLTGPGSIPGTLSYTVTASQATPGVGWIINTANGTVNVTASCTIPVVTAPALSPLGLLACGLLLLGLVGAVAQHKLPS